MRISERVCCAAFPSAVVLHSRLPGDGERTNTATRDRDQDAARVKLLAVSVACDSRKHNWSYDKMKRDRHLPNLAEKNREPRFGIFFLIMLIH